MTEPAAYVHAIGTAVPGHDIHTPYIDWAKHQLVDVREQALFSRMAERSGIDHRWSVLLPGDGGNSPIDPGGFYAGDSFPLTGQRMQVYAREAPALALAAIEDLIRQVPLENITHLVVASCTGFVAPGIDQIIVQRLGLGPNVERTLIGFMGCYAAVSALRVAHYIARADRTARILVVTVELCSLHLIDSHDIKVLLAAMQFADGAAAALVSAQASGIRLERFLSMTLPDSEELIQWTIGDAGFEMVLSGEVPNRIAHGLDKAALYNGLLGVGDHADLSWAIHPGGKSILDAVEAALELDSSALAASRAVLAQYGNMSSSTLMFVLAELGALSAHGKGIAMAFGPGMAAETFAFDLP